MSDPLKPVAGRPELYGDAASGGERQNGRRAIDAVAKDLIASGYDPRRAQYEARQSVLRIERERR